MSETPEPPPFECPLCNSMIQQKNIEKHMLNMHKDSKTIHKYVRCQICSGLFLKHKLTPHVHKAHKAEAKEAGATKPVGSPKARKPGKPGPDGKSGKGAR